MTVELLTSELRKAHALALEFKGGFSDHFNNAEQFAKALGDAIEQFESGDASALEQVHLWFLPTSDWDDLIGHYGIELGQSVSNLVTAQLGCKHSSSPGCANEPRLHF